MRERLKPGIQDVLRPAWARQMHGLQQGALGTPLIRAGAFGVAQTLRWAFAGTR